MPSKSVSLIVEYFHTQNVHNHDADHPGQEPKFSSKIGHVAKYVEVGLGHVKSSGLP